MEDDSFELDLNKTIIKKKTKPDQSDNSKNQDSLSSSSSSLPNKTINTGTSLDSNNTPIKSKTTLDGDPYDDDLTLKPIPKDNELTMSKTSDKIIRNSISSSNDKIPSIPNILTAPAPVAAQVAGVLKSKHRLNEKFLLFTYKSEAQDEMKVEFNLENSADYENNEEINIFTKFNLPQWLDAQHGLDASFSDYCIFYINLSRIDYLNKSYKLVQQVNRRYDLLYPSYYASNRRTLRKEHNDEFLFDLEFNKNNKYKYYKMPNGTKIYYEVDKIIYFFIFILFQKFKSQFEMLDYFLDEYETYYLKENSTTSALNNQDAIHFYINSLNYLYSFNRKIEQLEHVPIKKQILFIYCGLGLIELEYYPLANIEKLRINLNLIRDFIGLLSNDDLVLVTSATTSTTKSNDRIGNNTTRYFNRGLDFIIYCCILDTNLYLFELLVPFISKIFKLKPIDYSIEDTIESFINFGYLLPTNNLEAKKEIISNQLKEIRENDIKLGIISILLNLLSDLNDLITLVEICLRLNLENDLKELLDSRKDKIVSRFLNFTNQINSNSLIAQFKRYTAVKDLLSDYHKEIILFFTLHIDDFDLKLNLIDEIKVIYKDDDQVWLKVINQFETNLSKKYKISQLVRLVEYLARLETETKSNEKINTLIVEFRIKCRNELLESFEKLIGQSLVDETTRHAFKMVLGNPFIFKFGCLKYLKEKLPKLSIKTNNDLKFLIVEIVIEQLDKSERETFISFFKLLLNSIRLTYLDEYSQIISEIFKSLNKKLAALASATAADGADDSSSVNDNLDQKIFRDFLESFYKTNNLDSYIKLINHQQIFINDQFENIYIKIIKENLSNEYKNKRPAEVYNFIRLFTEKLNMTTNNKLKGKLISLLFSVGGNHDAAASLSTESVKELLIYSPSKDYFVYKLLEFCQWYPDLDQSPFIQSLKKNIRSFMKQLVDRDLLMADVDALKALNQDKIQIIFDYVNFSYSNNQDVNSIKKPNVRNEINDCIQQTNEILNSLVSAHELIEFLKNYSNNLTEIEASIIETLSSKEKISIKNLVLPPASFDKDLCESSKFYNKFKSSSTFANTFKKIYSNYVQISLKIDENDTEKVKNILNVSHFNELFELIKTSYTLIKSKLNDAESVITKSFLLTYFNDLKTNEQIENELKFIRDQIGITEQTAKFLHLSIFNFAQIGHLSELFESLLKCFESFKLNSTMIRETILAYMKLIEDDEFKLNDLNSLVEKINNQIGFFTLRKPNEEVLVTVIEMGYSDKLIDYLLSKNEQDLRNLVDSLDEHGDGHIRVQNIIELCKVTHFFQKISQKNKSEKEFLKSIVDLIEQADDETFRNISAMIHTSNNLLESVKLIIDTLQNREEASKIKIVELGKNAQFKIVFNQSTKSFCLSTFFREKKELFLNDLYDLRDRALLMVNNQNNTVAQQSFLETNLTSLEAIKHSYEIFISSIESLNNIVNYMNQSYKNGYSIDELYNEKTLRIIDEQNDEILQFEKHITNECKNWQREFISLAKKFYILNYFWGRELITIQNYLINRRENNNLAKLKKHFYFINSNIYDFNDDDDDEMFDVYPDITNKTPIERIQILAEYLDKLFKKLPKPIRLKIKETEQQQQQNDQQQLRQDSLNSDDYSSQENFEQIILVKTEHHKYYLNALTICYRDHETNFPLANQLLFCNSSTSWQELRSFLFRLVFNEEKQLFGLIGPERLNFENQDLFLDNFLKLISTNEEQHFIKLAVITCDQNCHIVNIMSQLSLEKIKFFKFQNHKDILNVNCAKQLVMKWERNVKLVHSSYSGLGKSTFIRREATLKNKLILINHPLSDCTDDTSFLTFIQHINEIMSNNNNNNNAKIETNQKSYALHFDIYNSNNDEKLNEFLFMIILLKVFKIDEHIFTTSNVSSFYIEIANTFRNVLREKVYIGNLFQQYHIEKFSIDEFVLDDYNEVNNEPVSIDAKHFEQLVCNYLKLVKDGQVNTNGFEIESIKKFDKVLNKNVYYYSNNMKRLDAKTCSNLLNEYFCQKLNEQTLSFTQLHNFINLLGYYLNKFTENAFFFVSTIQFIVEPLENVELKTMLSELRQKILILLIEFAQKIVTNSVNLARENQHETFERLNAINTNNNNNKQEEEDNNEHKKADEDNFDEELHKYMSQQLVSFENCNYVIVVFSESSGGIQLIYSNKNVLSKNIISLFKSQDIDKFNRATGFMEAHLLEYIKNEKDTSLFIDYREQTHEFLLRKLYGILKTSTPQQQQQQHDQINEAYYEIDKSLFEEDEKLISLINRLNKNLSVVVKKLDRYILSADNFLKMILIYNKMKSYLPVVIMGETGCGKTSLIAYLAIKVLNVKFITFNIHAGIFQAAFLEQMSHFIKIAEKLAEQQIWLFFDEFNTSECIFLISEMICKGTLLGKSIPSNLRILAACNPYKLKSKNLEVGLVIQRETSRLLHIVYPLPESLIEHIWDYGILNENDEKNYIKSMISSLELSDYEMVKDILFMTHQFIRNIEEASSVSLRDVDRFRIFYQWFSTNIKNRPKIIQNNRNKFIYFGNENRSSRHLYFDQKSFEIKCIILSMFICYYIRLSKKSLRDKFIDSLSIILKRNGFNQYSSDVIFKIYEQEQDEYLNRMNLPKGIAKNYALRENVFATFACIMNRIPIFICGKPGCSKTLSIQLISSSLRGIESIDPWFKTLPGLFTVTYQGSESSTSEGIMVVFEKAKNIANSFQKENNNRNQIIPLIVFDEMGLAEISKNNPLKVLHSLLESDNLDVSFVGISNWRLDASKMNRGVFVSRTDLSLNDLENTADVIFDSFIINANQNILNYSVEKYFIKHLANAYHNYKNKLTKSNYRDFHGTRDFYYLIKQVSEKLTDKKYYDQDEILSIIDLGLERNFQGIKEKVCNIKQEFINSLNLEQRYQKYKNIESNKYSTMDLIRKNLQDNNSRYLMLITKSDSATYILDNFLNDYQKDRITFVGSKFEEDLNIEEYSFRTLSDIILFMEKGWTVIMQDMNHIYGSLYDLFNQNFTIIGGNKKNCRITLGSVINPMCYVNDQFHCIIIIQEDQLSKCEPPFLNRFEKYVLSFETILSDEESALIRKLKDWLDSILLFNSQILAAAAASNNNSDIMALEFENIVVNYNDESFASLVLYLKNKISSSLDTIDDVNGLVVVDGNDDNYSSKENFILENSKRKLIKTFSNFSLLVATQSTMAYENENELKNFIDIYKETFLQAENLSVYLKNKFTNSNIADSNKSQSPSSSSSSSSFKTIVYTFDSVSKILDLSIDKNEYEETKIGFFNSEKYLNQTISKFFKSNKKLIIIRLEWTKHAQHLQLIKFLIEKLELDNNRSKLVNDKSFCILIHMDFFADSTLKKSLNQYKMSFLSDWDQIMIDCLDDKFFSLSDILFESSNELIIKERIVKFEEISYELCLNAINKFKYVLINNNNLNNNNNEEEEEDRINNYKKHLLEYILGSMTTNAGGSSSSSSVNSNNNNELEKIYLFIIECLKKKLWSTIESLLSSSAGKDWRLQIATDSDLLLLTYDVRKLLRNWIIKQLSCPFIELFYSIESYFPFETIITNFAKENSFVADIFMKTLEYEFVSQTLKNAALGGAGGGGDLKIKNANQANEIKCLFDLRIPFILKETKRLDNLKELNDNINLINTIEKTIRSIETNTKDGQFELKNETIRVNEAIDSIKKILIKETIYFICLQIIEKNEIILKYFLNDLIRIKFRDIILTKNKETSSMTTTITNKTYENFLETILDLILKHNNSNQDGNNYNDLASLYYYVYKSRNFIEKIFEYLIDIQKFVQFDSLVSHLRKQNFKNDYRDFIFIEDKILTCIVDYSSTELVRKCSDEEFLKSYKLNDLANLFTNCFIETFSIKLQFRLIVKSYWCIYFMNEFLKTLTKIYKDDDGDGGDGGDGANKALLLDVSKLISTQLNDIEFLKNLNTIKQIIDLIEERTRKIGSTEDGSSTTNNSEIQELVARFENFIYFLYIEITNERDIISVVFDQFNSNPNLIKSSYSLFQKLFLNLVLDIDLNFLKNEYESSFYQVINDEIANRGLDSNFSIIILEILSNKLEDIDEIFGIWSIRSQNNNMDDQNQPEQLDDNGQDLNEQISQATLSIIKLYEVLKNYESDFQNEHINSIEYKNIAYLSSVAYLRSIVKFYCDELILYGDSEIDNEFNRVVNQLLSDKDSNISSSLRILALRVLYQTKSSLYELKEFVLSNQNIKWKTYLEFGEPKALIDINIFSDNLIDDIKVNSKILLDLIHSKQKVPELQKQFEQIILDPAPNNSPSLDLSLLLSIINVFYFPNTNEIFYDNESNKLFRNYYRDQVEPKLNNFDNNKKLLFSTLFSNIVYDFNTNNNDDDEEFLNLKPNRNVDDIELISIVLNCFSIILSHSSLDNPLSSMFFEENTNGNIIKNFENKTNQYWICTNDDEEYEILTALKDVKFVAYSDDDIANGRYDGNGFALYKCSNECKFYYTVGNCTRPTENHDLKCPKEHLLMGPQYNQLYPRDGHKKIPDAENFIKSRLVELKKQAPKGYLPIVAESILKNYTIRSLNSISYRILHLIIHSCFYMFRILNIYDENQMKILLNLNDKIIDDEKFNFKNTKDYLKSHIVKDFNNLKMLLESNHSYVFIHAVLFKIPDFLKRNSIQKEVDQIDTRNNFEIKFENDLVAPLLKSINQSIIDHKNLFSNEQQINVIKLLLDELSDSNFLKSIKKQYPLIKLMRSNKQINLNNFENAFSNSNYSKKYPLIDLFLKNRLNLEKLETLSPLVKITNYLMNKYDHNILRRDAREKKLIDCFDEKQDPSSSSSSLYEDFEHLKQLWNKYLNITFEEGCNNQIKGVQLEDTSSLALLLIDNRYEIGSGIQTRLALQYLASAQNNFLSNVLLYSHEVPFIKKLNKEKLQISSIKPYNILDLNDLNVEFHIQTNSFIDPEYGRGLQIEYDYEKFQFILLNKLIVGKRLIDTDKDNIRRIQYSGELLYNNVYLIDSLRKKIPQKSIEKEKLNEIKQLIKEFNENKENEIIKYIYTSLDTLICFIGSNLVNRSEITIKKYANNLGLRNISDHVKKNEPLSSLLLCNIVEVYEIFENEMFDLSRNTFDDKYKKNLDEKSKIEFQNFWDKCDGKELPTKQDIYDALKKFSMRCLLADLDENEGLSVYLSLRVDLWSESISLEQQDNLTIHFPESIKVMHTLGNLMSRLDKEFAKKVINKPKEEPNIKARPDRAPIGRPQIRAPNKNAKKFEMI